MKIVVTGLCGLLLMVALMVPAVRSQELQPATTADVSRWKKELSNWGRWGQDDELGALNLITPAKRKQAASLVTEGLSVSLARDLDTTYAVDNVNPTEHQMGGLGVDRLANTLGFHGYGHTHIDALAHLHDKGVFYNGYTPNLADVLSKRHARNSIVVLQHGIFTRGVLIDVPRLKGVDYLEPGTHIYPADIEAWEKRAGVKVAPGDALLVYIGRWVRRTTRGPWDVAQHTAGLDASMIPWLKQRDVAVLGGEVDHDVKPGGSDFGRRGPIHDFASVYLGVTLLDGADFTALAEAAAARKRWEFLFTAAPLRTRGGTGSPVNPTATF